MSGTRPGPRESLLALGALTLRRAVLESPATTPPEARRAAFDGSPEEPDVARFVSLVRQHAYRVTDADVAVLTALGLSDDEVFEITVAAALGAATECLDAALALVESGGSDDAPS